MLSPPVISSGTFITVLRMLSVMSAGCPDLALNLLKQNIAETLCYLLTGSADASSDEVPETNPGDGDNFHNISLTSPLGLYIIWLISQIYRNGMSSLLRSL